MLLEHPGWLWIHLYISGKPSFPNLTRPEMGEEKVRRKKYFPCFDFPVHETIFSFLLAQVFKLQLLLLQPQLIFHLPKKRGKERNNFLPVDSQGDIPLGSAISGGLRQVI